MIQHVTIVGGKGNMGKRYRAIFDHLHINYRIVDTDTEPANGETDAFLVVTPTDTHMRVCADLLQWKKPVLCEKPVVRNLPQLRLLVGFYEAQKVPFSMIMQYRELIKTKSSGQSWYNYFNHGKDGLAWDCMQTLALAKGEVTLGENSPFWNCQINGEQLHIAEMDGAYISFIRKWLDDPGYNSENVVKAHESVERYLRNTGAWNVQP